ncbi:hypothetical protein TRICI_006466 [Trichomonascus ciferrii]|uniref:Pre-mRNA polyadenylation factor FIP1 n=1 Tax=Trichomonascus ciferrii TaxID=44093 RepID=A0A642UH55_9ASCO|nr:hypothetical protein TRICI_006466 [Trichomonascus ciferrii]
MSSEDEEDEFLYGSEAPSTKRQKQGDDSVQKEDEEIRNAPPPPAPQSEEPSDKKTEEPEEQEGDEDEESDESDIEFVIDTKPGQKAEPASRSAQMKAEGDKSEKEQQDGEEKAAAGGLDINAVAEHDGKPLTQVNLESFEDKPWRQPGADITDYFNYGFDEFTWTAYCSKQDNLREDFNPQKVMNQMMGGMGMPMDMPMFPPEFMQQMMGGFPPMPMPGGNGGGNGGFGSNQPSHGSTPQPPPPPSRNR